MCGQMIHKPTGERIPCVRGMAEIWLNLIKVHMLFTAA